VQLLLQLASARIPHEQADCVAKLARQTDTYTCSPHFRPLVDLQYEHMFSSNDTPLFARRLLGCLHLIRSFLLLEDDYDVDWEVDQDRPIEPPRCGSRLFAGNESKRGDHPHRMALRSRLDVRRPGVPAPREQVCLCPLPPRGHRGEQDSQRGSSITTGSVRVAIDPCGVWSRSSTYDH
jgi:hypothetical protein